jgi:tungstate transport system substrate-binding protein
VKRFFLLGIFAYALSAGTSLADTMKLAVTTSFHNSGLSDVLLPEIKKDIGLDVYLLVVGTGQALKLGRAGDVDAILVHSRKAEEEFVAQGFGSHRRELMYNDFILIGPKEDPAMVADQKSAVSALTVVARSKSLFVSRGDDSGTNRKEIFLWREAGLDPDNFSATWYRATGSGMGATLNTANAMQAYVFADRASWLNFKNKENLKLVFEGDPILFNQYSYIPIQPERFPYTKSEQARKLENWLVSEKAQRLIANYTIAGQQLFTPNASTQ